MQKNYTVVHEINSSEKHGLVCILDALGVKQITEEEKLTEFVKNWFNLLSLSRWTISHEDNNMIKFYNFSDTIAITTEGDDVLKQIDILSFHLGLIFSEGLKKRIFLRGAISEGDYCEKELVTKEESGEKPIGIDDFNKFFLVGSAWFDASTWFGETDWIGINTTPTLGSKLNSFDRPPKNFIKYRIPKKDGFIDDCWALNWPQMFLDSNGIDYKTPQDIKNMILEKRTIEERNCKKHLNTMKFFDFVFSD